MLEDLTPLEITERRKFMSRHFVVTGNKSKQGGLAGRAQFRFAVVCSDIKRALQLTEVAYPDCTVFSVADQGVVDKVDA